MDDETNNTNPFHILLCNSALFVFWIFPRHASAGVSLVLSLGWTGYWGSIWCHTVLASFLDPTYRQ